MVTRDPSLASGTPTEILRSWVTLSDDERPASELAARSTLSSDESAVRMVIGKTGDAGVRLPARSTASEVPTTFHTPSASKGRSQPVAEAEATYEQTTSGYPARDAVMVMVEPSVAPGRKIPGVESLVMLSVEEAPVSDEATRSGS